MWTTKELFEHEKIMIALEEEGKLRESAEVALTIIKECRYEPLFEKEAIQCCFHEISRSDFYKHLLQVAKKICADFK